MRVLIAVTHLLGTGHLSRALTLARAFADAGHDTCVISGGMPAPQLDVSNIALVQLPPLRSDGTDFTRLLNQSGKPVDTALFEARRDALAATLNPVPDIVITELFPFGRRILADEFLAFIAAARDLLPRPVILSSVRDILAPPSKPRKAAAAEAIIAEHFDAVLVHSDPRGTKLDTSWPVTPDLAPKLHYTGYVAPAPSGPHPSGTGTGEVIISAGGGSVGMPVFSAAIDAARLMPEHRWRLLVGGGDGPQRIAELQGSSPPPNVILEPARPDFRQMLYNAAASVSMCGYNTALDILQAGTPAVFVPFDAGQEVEQGLRAQSLSALPGVEILRSAALSGPALRDAVARAIAAPRRAGPVLQFDGADRSVQLSVGMAEARQ